MVMVMVIGVVEELWFHRPSSGSLKLARVIARYLPRPGVSGLWLRRLYLSYTIYHACLFPSRVHAHHPHPFCDHGRATLLIVVHNRDSICQVPPTLFKHQDPDGNPDIQHDMPTIKKWTLVSSIRTALCQWEAADRRVDVFVLDGGAGASGDFELMSCDGLHWHNGIPGLVFI